MTRFKEVAGDLIKNFEKDEYDAIVHGCNCFHIMGAGIANQISLKYPQAFAADKQSDCGSMFKLGTLTIADTSNGKIVNAYTQFLPGANFEYSAFLDCLETINAIFKGKHVAFPQIGCGIGGGQWLYVVDMLKLYLKDLKQVTVVHYDNGDETVGQGRINFQP